MYELIVGVVVGSISFGSGAIFGMLALATGRALKERDNE